MKIIKENRLLKSCPFRYKNGCHQEYCKADDSVDCYYKMTDLGQIALNVDGVSVSYYPCWYNKAEKLIQMVRGEYEA